MSTLTASHPRSALLLAFVAIVLAGGLTLVAAQSNDGRVNPDDFAGGTAIYCVDSFYAPAAHWSDGGIWVLDANGQELIFVSAENIEAASEDVTSETPVLIGTGESAFGPLELYLLSSGEFQLTGFEDEGKPFSFLWGGCAGAASPDVETTQMPEPTQITAPV
ncbi:MAG: hypothetical protein U0452_05015 [Anaerolineae bacterium]